MTTHFLHRERTPESIIGTCSCGNWSTESSGHDASSWAWVGWGFERHEGGVK